MSRCSLTSRSASSHRRATYRLRLAGRRLQPRRRGPVSAIVAIVAVLLVASTVTSAADAWARPSRRTLRARALVSFRAGVADYQAGRFDTAASKFKGAFDLDSRPVYLFNAARATQRGGDRDQAALTYRRVIALPGVAPKIVSRCQTLLAEIRDARRREAALALKIRAQERSRQVARERRVAANAWRTPTGWSGVAGGVLVMAGTAYLLTGAAASQRSLDAKVARRDADGRVVGIDAASYNTEQDRLNRALGLGIALGGVGVAAAAVGAWLLWSTPSNAQVALLPQLNGRGARLIVGF